MGNTTRIKSISYFWDDIADCGFYAAFIQPNGSGSFWVTISPYLKPYQRQNGDMTGSGVVQLSDIERA
jgi:hypothetical protein